MKRHRFIGAFDLTQKTFRVVEREMIHQMMNVLHLEVGEQVVLCDGKGQEVLAELKEVSKDLVMAQAVEVLHATPQSSREVILYCAILKRENFEFVVQKATEVGVTEIVPLITRRTIKQNVKVARLQEIAKEAAEQSGRGTVPVVSAPIVFEEAVASAKRNGENYFFDVGGEGESMKSLGNRVGLFIGPEGGWDVEERAVGRAAGFIVSRLGPFVLRGETAAMIASYLACID